MNLIEQVRAMPTRQIAANLKASGMRCNCDLDNWEPEQSTGHSQVCRIHAMTMTAKHRPYDLDDAALSRIKGE